MVSSNRLVRQNRSHLPRKVAVLCSKMGFCDETRLEGVPQRAIARALQLSAHEVGEVVADAVARGMIVQPSESEWPQGSRAPRLRPLPDLRSMKGRCWRRHRAWR